MDDARRPSGARAISTVLVALTAVRPLWGLTAVALLLPLNPLLRALVFPQMVGATLAEIWVASFLCAAGLRLTFGLRPAASQLAAPALALGAIVAASGLLELAERQQATTWPLDFARDFASHLARGYYGESPAFGAFHSATIWIEGLALAVFAERVFRAGGLAPSRLVGPLTAAAAHAWVRLAQVSLRQEHPIAAAGVLLQTVRINTLFTDVNAAGSLLALYFVPAVWMAYACALGDGSRRRAGAALGYVAAAAVIGLALWMTYSRSAWAGAVAGVAAVWIFTRRTYRLALSAGALAVAGLIAIFVVMSPGSSAQASSSVALGVRWEMAKIALQIAEEHPITGVGVGGFRVASRAHVTDDLIARFPATASGENAHNNFLQILAELGIGGLAAFTWLLTSAALSLRGARAVDAPRAGQIALAGGVAAFLVTCLGGHPFLTPEVLWLFMLVLGAMASSGVEPAGGTPTGRVGWTTVAIVVAVVVSVPVRLWQLRHDNARKRVIGASAPTDLDADRVYRNVAARSAWPVPAHARGVQVPLGLSPDSSDSCLVHIDIDGRPANVVTVAPGVWTPVVLQLEPRPRGGMSRSLELRVEGAGCRLRVGELTIRE